MGLFGRFGRRDRPGSTAGQTAVDAEGHVRPFTPPVMATPFVAERAPGEIEEAFTTILRDGLSPWDEDRAKPRELTDGMLAEAEKLLGLKLPSSLLAILRIRNGGIVCKSSFCDDYRYLPYIQGLGSGDTQGESLETMPRRIWSLLEGYLDDRIYREWWESFGDGIHPDWDGKPRMPEAILLLADDVHWGIALNYVRCGRQGEPSIVSVEMESPRAGKDILDEIAPDFMSFLGMLFDEHEGKHGG